MDSATWAALGCVVGLLVPIAVGIVALTWTTGEIKAMLLGWLDRR